MREIKFRVWDSVLHEYRELDMNSGKQNFGMGFEVTGGIGGKTTTIYHSVGDIIEQYTGLKDVNGVEIYEGDILKDVSPTAYQGVIGYVKYYPKFGYCIMTKANGMWHSYHQEYWKYNDQMNYEVIGNIHENPELIEVVDK